MTEPDLTFGQKLRYGAEATVFFVFMALFRVIGLEAASSLGWREWAGDEGTIIGIDHYGASAPGDEILKHFGFTAEHVTSAALRLLGRNDEASKEYGGETSFAPTSPQEGHS